MSKRESRYRRALLSPESPRAREEYPRLPIPPFDKGKPDMNRLPGTARIGLALGRKEKELLVSRLDLNRKLLRLA
jgi:hypothetical protein